MDPEAMPNAITIEDPAEMPKLYHVYRWGNPDEGPNGWDTHFLVQALGFGQAADLVASLLREEAPSDVERLVHGARRYGYLFLPPSDATPEAVLVDGPRVCERHVSMQMTWSRQVFSLADSNAGSSTPILLAEGPCPACGAAFVEGRKTSAASFRCAECAYDRRSECFDYVSIRAERTTARPLSRGSGNVSIGQRAMIFTPFATSSDPYSDVFDGIRTLISGPDLVGPFFHGKGWCDSEVWNSFEHHGILAIGITDRLLHGLPAEIEAFPDAHTDDHAGVRMYLARSRQSPSDLWWNSEIRGTFSARDGALWWPPKGFGAPWRFVGPYPRCAFFNRHGYETKFATGCPDCGWLSVEYEHPF